MKKSCFIVAVLLSGCVARDGRGPEPARGGGQDIDLVAGWRVVVGRVAPRATLAALLRAHGILESDVASTIAQAASRFDLRKVRAAQPYRITTAADGSLRSLDYEIDGDRALHVHREPDGDLAADVAEIPKSRRRVVVRGTIDRASPSLFAAMDAAGESIDLSVALAEIFGGEIDFSTELQPGDRFEVVVEKRYREPEKAFAGYGPIIAAQIENAGRRVRAVHFAPDGSAAGYYDERGVSMRRFFLKSPLKFEPVVTSAFSSSRFHPILREYRAHLGVDYKAPAGAPVIAVADGLVLQAEMNGGAGRFVHLRHANGYETEYLHLSSIAVRPGAHVHQGDLIGRVGSTGLATGPHLDYRVKRAGAFIDPLAAHRAMPPAEPVPAEQMAAFREIEDQTFAAFSSEASGGAVRASASTHHR
ncbi:MAG TPA: M23 family metallopeptidase [Vicinamibacterales bacterium]